MGIKKATSLKTIFRIFTIRLFILLFLAFIIPFSLFTLMERTGHSVYANYDELQAIKLQKEFAAASDLERVKIPSQLTYLILDKDFNTLDGNMSHFVKSKAIAFAKDDLETLPGNLHFLLVVKEKEYCVIQYPIGARFTDDWLNDHLPSPDICLILLVIINCVIVFVTATAALSKRLNKQLDPLLLATREVAGQNLDFTVGQSSIKEFDDILRSFSQMKTNLKLSLEQQWKAEQTQRNQISALAHDLKTPLTVVQGNLDLLSETALDSDQKVYTKYASDGSQQMEAYIKTLIDISKSRDGYKLQVKEFDFQEFWQKIIHQSASLCECKNLSLKNENCLSKPYIFSGDPMLLERAVMNLISNAVDYSPQNSTIIAEVQSRNHALEISITDCGKGFSPEVLRHGREQFFMGDPSRNSGQHYGMGLYITDSIIRQHHGQLILKNSEQTHGAQTIIRLI